MKEELADIAQRALFNKDGSVKSADLLSSEMNVCHAIRLGVLPSSATERAELNEAQCADSFKRWSEQFLTEQLTAKQRADTKYNANRDELGQFKSTAYHRSFISAMLHEVWL